ncbi:hypothetical protein PENSTE_c001G04450 [Penicillium steckii]|uniref:Uncharacterized protein n=1 Tax=Penicillium steckii TaxID=303698 RepID=A0A1V6U0Q6_9EURO|nr:hypothetical protein PENSTE_c001G04450 [Penicillium steckii]
MHLQILPIACYLLSISRTSSSAILPSTTDPSAFTIYLKASDYFPHSKTDLSSFDIEVYFSNFDPETKLWLTSLDPQTGTTDEAKARILTEISYAKKFDENDQDMIEDVQSILAAVTGNLTTTTSIPSASPSRDADSAYFVVDTRRHVVNWEGCTPFYQCVTGTLVEL